MGNTDFFSEDSNSAIVAFVSVQIKKQLRIDCSLFCCESESLVEQEAREQKWQERPLETLDAKRGLKKRNYSSVLERWEGDETDRTSQLAINWTEFYCRYLDYITTLDTSHGARCGNSARDSVMHLDAVLRT